MAVDGLLLFEKAADRPCPQKATFWLSLLKKNSALNRNPLSFSS
jgi:hypothetical protein